MTANSLLGTWKLLAFEARAEDGQVTSLFGPDPIGYITYTHDGYVFVAFMRADRPRFTSSDYYEGTLEEMSAAMRSFFSYCGTYNLRGSRIVHHLEVCGFPNWVGMDQERIYSFEGNRLTLSTDPYLLAGRQQSVCLVWQRV